MSNDPKPTKGIESLNLNALRVSQDFASASGVRQVIRTVPVRKPGRFQWFRSREDMSIPTTVIDHREESAIYLVAPNLRDALADVTVVRELAFVMTTTKVPMIVPVGLPGPDGRTNPWHLSLREAIHLAADRWVRITPSMDVGAYLIHEAVNDLGEPEWPEQTFEELLRVAFQGRFIEDLDHPLIRKLRGEVL